jgi:hypothetical protein
MKMWHFLHNGIFLTEQEIPESWHLMYHGQTRFEASKTFYNELIKYYASKYLIVYKGRNIIHWKHCQFPACVFVCISFLFKWKAVSKKKNEKRCSTFYIPNRIWKSIYAWKNVENSVVFCIQLFIYLSAELNFEICSKTFGNVFTCKQTYIKNL